MLNIKTYDNLNEFFESVKEGNFISNHKGWFLLLTKKYQERDYFLLAKKQKDFLKNY